MSEIFWSVDSLVIKENTIFGFGWAFHTKHEIHSIQFRLTFKNSKNNGYSLQYISADAGKAREDVQNTFEKQARALNSGYVVYGAYSPGAKIQSITLVCSLADGSIVDLAVPISSVIQFGDASHSPSGKYVLRQFNLFFKRAVHLIRLRKFKSLFEKVTRYLKGKPRRSLEKPSDLARLLRQEEDKNICLIVDHDLGGGANHYRQRLVDGIISDGRTVVLVTYHVATLSHVLVLKNVRVNLRFSVRDKDFILNAVKNLSISEVIYNTAVSFGKPEEIPHLLISLKQITSAQLRILVHDFFMACPSHFLINHEGKHCHLPDISVCTRCLPENQQGFTTLFFERDILKWRSIWGSMLSIADEIVTFSNSSKEILHQAYPHLPLSQIMVQPHKDHFMWKTTLEPSQIAKLRIGVVGQIGFHKGANFIKELALVIKKRNLDISIVIVGSIEASCDSSIVMQTGMYSHDELPRFIENSGANTFLFPSIWPETFSYVAQELIEMGLPVACFNLGAPSERILNYPKGLILNSMEPALVLDELIDFYQKIYHIQ